MWSYKFAFLFALQDISTEFEVKSEEKRKKN